MNNEQPTSPTMSPTVAKPIEKVAGQTFAAIIPYLLDGKMIMRMEWPAGYYLVFHEERLRIYKPDTNQLHDLVIQSGDFANDDWCVMESSMPIEENN